MKQFKYLSYVLRHKWFVFIECCKLGIPRRGLIHDWSKFLPSEWLAYTNYFYTRKRPDHVPHEWRYRIRWQEDYKDDFDFAWLLHQKRNPHHWQFWILQNDTDGLKLLEMPEVFAKEMLADWKGAGRAIHGKDDIAGWYAENRAKMQIHPATFAWLDKQIGFAVDLELVGAK